MPDAAACGNEKLRRETSGSKSDAGTEFVNQQVFTRPADFAA